VPAEQWAALRAAFCCAAVCASLSSLPLTDLGSAAACSSCAGGAPPARKSGMGGGAVSALLCVTPMAGDAALVCAAVFAEALPPRIEVQAACAVCWHSLCLCERRCSDA
jgi:hypothetical protein